MEQKPSIDNNSPESKLNLLAQKLGSLIADGPNVPSDYTFSVSGDTLNVSTDKIFGENIQKCLSSAYAKLKYDQNMKEIKQIGNKVHAELIIPVGEVSKIVLEIEKYRV